MRLLLTLVALVATLAARPSLRIRKVVGSLLTPWFLSGSQPILPANAASSTASTTFSNAEKAMKETYSNFDAANKAWQSGARRLLTENAGIVGEKKKALQTVTSELTASSTAMSNLAADLKAMKSQVSGEIESLQLSTASNYEIAQAAADTGKRPAVTAGLFKTAQNGADTIMEDEFLVKDISSLIEKVDGMDFKLSEIVKDMNGHIEVVMNAEDTTARNTAMLETAIQGLQSLEIRGDGLVPVSGSSGGGGVSFSSAPGGDGEKPISGAALFKKGSQTIDQEQKKIWTELKKVQADARVANNVENDINKAASSIVVTVTKQDEWETETKLKNPVAKANIKMAKSKIDTVAKTVTNAINRLSDFNDGINNIYSNDKTKDKAKKQRKAVNGLTPALKDIANKLETYEFKSRETDALLQKATEAGRKEADKFAKFRRTAATP